MVSWLRARRALGFSADVDALLEFWRGRAPGSPTGASRYRFELSQGNVRGRCSTMRRADRSTQTASLINRSRRVVTCAAAQPVPAARRRSS